MDIYAIRKQNLLGLMAGKTQRSCADRWETSPSTLSQIVSKNPVRKLGDDLARKIEQAEGLPAGWFDHVHQGAAEPARAEQAEDMPPARRAVMGRALFEKFTPRSRALVDRILEMEAQGALTDEDLKVLTEIVERFGSPK